MYSDLISIIVPVYNGQDYLSQCIESVLKQTHQNIELILVNDGSTDNSEEICLKYAASDSRLVYIKQENGGAASARNRGLDICKGAYIGFVDCDDYIDDNMCETLLFAIKNHNADASQILSRRVTDEGVILNAELVKKTEGCPPEIFNGREAIEKYLLGNHSLCSHLYSAKLFQDVRIPENMSGEDLAVIIPLYKQCEKIVKISEYKYNYRLNKNSVTHTRINMRRINLLYEFEKQLKAYENDELYFSLLVLCISKGIISSINDFILYGGEYAYLENEFKEKLIYYLPYIRKNRFVSKRSAFKDRLYLKSRTMYKLLLKFKRLYYKKPLYGVE